jgi:2-oxoisovalerate dehydrogenase E2 component (dihydrolipoyl transacylase)
MSQFIFRLPDVGEGTTEAEIVAWHVAVGDRVEEDQPLADVMTDKATVEMTTPVSGVILALHGELGEMAPVGQALAKIEVEGDVEAAPAKSAPHIAPEPAKAEPAKPAPKPEPAPAAVAKAAPVPTAPQPAPIARVEGHRPLASPAVRHRAEELRIDLASVAGTGPAGRISQDDLNRFLEGGSRAAPVVASGLVRREGAQQIKVIGLRRKIAEKMQDAKRRIPHFAYVEEVDVTELEDLRVHLNATKAPDQPRLTLLPFFVRALTRILPRYPQINATFDDDAGIIHRHAPVHLGIATQTPNGLIVPVLRHAEARDLWDCATEIARLAAAARDGKATMEELSGSTITLTSLGPLGGITTTPIINHPEVAIIGPNKMVERPVVRNGQIVVRRMMNLSSSFDHRVVDGYDAAEFIQAVKALLEHPATLFIDRT